MAENCIDVLDRNGLHADIDCIYDTTSIQRGASLTIYAQTNSGCVIGMDMAGKLGRTSEFIGRRVAEMFIEDLKSGATLDRHTADQLIIYAALASGTTSYVIPRITEHIDTNLWLIEEILGAKSVLDNNLLTIHGVGYQKCINYCHTKNDNVPHGVKCHF
jgi:RNA 3'-terminal phosphate cyclase (ATP)